MDDLEEALANRAEAFKKEFESTPDDEDTSMWFKRWFGKEPKIEIPRPTFGVWYDVVTMQPKMKHGEIIPVLRSLWRQGHGLVGKLEWYIPEGSFIFIFLHSYQGILKEFFYRRPENLYFRYDGAIRDPNPNNPHRFDYPAYELSEMQFRELVSMFCSALINFFERNPEFKARNIAWLMLLRAYPEEYPLNNFITRGYSLYDGKVGIQI